MREHGAYGIILPADEPNGRMSHYVVPVSLSLSLLTTPRIVIDYRRKICPMKMAVVPFYVCKLDWMIVLSAFHCAHGETPRAVVAVKV